jgi:hypothetical protein
MRIGRQQEQQLDEYGGEARHEHTSGRGADRRA